MDEVMTRDQAGGKTILLVEDNVTQALHLQALLEQEGLQVRWAEDGHTGLQMARRISPDMIVLDVQMPGLNGFQVCQKLKNGPGTADIPIVMLTRHDDPEAVVMGLERGAVDYIPKDAFADAVLLETLRQMGVIAPQAVGM